MRVRGPLAERWLDPLLHACETLQALPDTDRNATVRVVGNGRDLIVEVLLTDGRSTLRRVREPADLERTLEALLSVPPIDKTRTEERPPPEPNEMPPVDEKPPRRPEDRPAIQPFGVEAGLALGGRLAGNGYRSFAPELFAQLRADAWLVGANARWDVIQEKNNAASDLEMQTVAAAITFARRLGFDPGNLDLGLALRLLSETQSYEQNSAERSTDAQTDVRLGAFGRFALGKSTFRAYGQIDGELSPARTRHELRVQPELPALPAWSAGLAVGVVWGEP